MIKKVGIILGLGCITLLGGCTSQESNEASVIQKQDNIALFQEAQLNGCIECHRVKATVVGPSWLEIAGRYKDIPKKKARSILVYSVKNGSRGKFITWKGGDGMPALGNRVKDETIEKMVDYILKLND